MNGMTNLTLLNVIRSGLIPDDVFKSWKLCGDKRELIRSVNRNVDRAAMLTVISFSLLAITMSFYVEGQIKHEYIEKRAWGECVIGAIIMTLVTLMCWFWPNSFGTSINKLRELFSLSWVHFARLSILEMKMHADFALRMLAYQMKLSEVEHERGSPEANKAYDKFNDAYILCRLFDLAGPKKNDYINGWGKLVPKEEKVIELGGS